ncbi:hypothetical protein HDV06_000636 [Boothiomyces sp. JEL0866]|nr:hypothetical protein HDV06_000636 [Boothiomyces sp. JEL0866]
MEDAANATLASNSTFIDSVYEFSTNLITNPVQTLIDSPAFVLFVISLVVIPIILQKLFPSMATKDETLVGELLTDFTRVSVVESTDLLWEVGVSAKACSVSENGVLKAIEFSDGKPNVKHVVGTVMKAILDPIDGAVKKPKVLMFLDTCLLKDGEKSQITKELKDYEMTIVSLKQLEVDYPALHAERAKEVEIFAPQQPTVQQPLKMNPPPPRGCFACRKEIPGKASQCSACKAVIYCSADCAKQNWAVHKQTCKEFKVSVDHIQEWDLHNLPFAYYNKESQLHNYNVVPYLTTVNKHNVGLFQRLCGCFNEAPWGVLAARLIAHYQQTKPTPDQMFATLGLPEEMFPLSKPFDEGFDSTSIDSWENYFKSRGYSLDNPSALILEVPLTIYHMINQFHMKTAPAVPEGGTISINLERRRITIHLVGVEKEADLLPLFECLLPFYPKTDIAIHMIGNKICADIPPQQRAMMIKSQSNDSSIFISLNPTFYAPQHLDASAFQLPPEVPKEVLKQQNFGTDKPDLIICLNAGLVTQQEWGPFLQMVCKSDRKLLVTERVETLCNAALINIPKIGGKPGVQTHPNPFRQPLYDFKKDVNLPGWSNGFIFGIGDF